MGGRKMDGKGTGLSISKQTFFMTSCSGVPRREKRERWWAGCVNCLVDTERENLKVYLRFGDSRNVCLAQETETRQDESKMMV